jgi:hypothetical protein
VRGYGYNTKILVIVEALHERRWRYQSCMNGFVLVRFASDGIHPLDLVL